MLQFGLTLAGEGRLLGHILRVDRCFHIRRMSLNYSAIIAGVGMLPSLRYQLASRAIEDRGGQ